MLHVYSKFTNQQSYAPLCTYMYIVFAVINGLYDTYVYLSALYDLLSLSVCMSVFVDLH